MVQRMSDAVFIPDTVFPFFSYSVGAETLPTQREESYRVDTMVEEVVNKVLNTDLGNETPSLGAKTANMPHDSDPGTEKTQSLGEEAVNMPHDSGAVVKDTPSLTNASDEDLRNAAHFLKRVTTVLFDPVVLNASDTRDPEPLEMNICELFAAVDAFPGRYVSYHDALYFSEARLHPAGTPLHTLAGKKWQKHMGAMDKVNDKVGEFYKNVHAMLDTLPPFLIHILRHDLTPMRTAIKLVDDEIVARTRAVFGMGCA